MPDPEAMLLAKESFSFLEARRELASPDTRLSEIAILSSPEAVRKADSAWIVKDVFAPDTARFEAASQCISIRTCSTPNIESV